MPLEQSESINELAAALAKAQGLIEPASKDSTNPHFKSKFADLASVWDVCRGPLSTNGISVVQAPEVGEHGPVLRTTLMHSSGQWVASVMPLFFDGKSMQSLGSALTYARRYSLCPMVGIVADVDDDGNAAEPPAYQGQSYQRPREEPRREPERREPPREQQPQSRERREPSQGHSQSNGNGQVFGDRPPKTGRAIFAWCKKADEENKSNMLKHLNDWAKQQGFPGRMVDWNEEDVALAYAEAERKFGPARGSQSQTVPDDDDEDGDINF